SMRSQHKHIHVQNFHLRGQKELTKKKAALMSCPSGYPQRCIISTARAYVQSIIAPA
ncbi:MAG: hypothetical protein ACI85N_001381, partial [Gammaproteobacteria bacterium]